MSAWSPVRDALLTEVYENPGVSVERIASVLGVTASAVYRRARRMGLTRRRAARRLWTADELRELAELRDEGRPLTVIASRLGRPYDSVKKKLRQMRRAAW